MNPFRVPVIFIIFSLGDAQGYHNLSRWDKNITFSILLQLPLKRQISNKLQNSKYKFQINYKTQKKKITKLCTIK